MKQHSLNFGFTARYFQLGELNKTTKNIFFVFHGHGQLSKYFIRKFSSLDNGTNCIIAPEGLSRYYLEGYSGRVGATWMTKEDRLRDIDNYLSYLDALFLKYEAALHDNVNIIIVGFSQGAATASRWVTSSPIRFDSLVLWAGIFPPDMNIDFASQKLKNKVVKYVYGEKDPLLTADKLEEMHKISQQLNIQPDVLTFNGAHEIAPEIFPSVFDLH
ncbi:alpha/beta hydrolase [Fulvivirga sp. M361]|uniref:alpha/beta hydrolase n=1 Tax=Fulvivirga sp. M361 TaxID=2594266 RepID=UPI00117B07B5|nr:dienelactone hydrolase family protein [Fulvivirga sp. M361]TRX57765.1 alpha/beta hydrolase [Fulvivirga sp. M361]